MVKNLKNLQVIKKYSQQRNFRKKYIKLKILAKIRVVKLPANNFLITPIKSSPQKKSQTQTQLTIRSQTTPNKNSPNYIIDENALATKTIHLITYLVTQPTHSWDRLMFSSLPRVRLITFLL